MVLNSIVFELALMCWERGSLWDESSVECPQRLVLEVQWIRVVGGKVASLVSMFFLQVKLGSGWEE